ncbi:MAG TPA: hypothetical protein GXZ48_07735 [Acholeplasmataceae bacterium]|nr:hypothetical protein [Acholeplasmataceae bacterium]
MKLGLISKYKVTRKTDIGYMINDDSGEYFLHNNECNHQNIKVGDIVSAFLFIDKKKRVAATLNIPKITLDQGNLCEVVGVDNAGVFVNIGISRDILLSSDDLIDGKWPIVGDKVCCKLHRRGDNLFIRLLNKQEIIELQKGNDLEVGKKYPGHVYRITKEGINIVEEEGFNIIFVYYKNLRKSYRIGEKVEVKIINKNSDDYSGTLIAQKELLIKDDAQVIYDYLVSHNGTMPFSSKTSPELIYKVFKMSKAAFKRALGNLYKQEKVLLFDDKTILNRGEKNEN